MNNPVRDRRAGKVNRRWVRLYGVELGGSEYGQGYLDARVVLIDVFVEVSFDDSVVIDAESFAERILGDLQAPVNIPP